MEGYLTFGLTACVTLIVVYIFSATFRSLLLCREGKEKTFSALHQGLLVLFLVQWLIVLLSKYVDLPLFGGTIIIWGGAVILLRRALSQKRIDANSIITIIFILSLVVTLAQFGAPISKWDGSAHLTFINSMTRQGAGTIERLSLLDETLNPLEPFCYYPYLVHSLIASFLAWLPSTLFVRPAAYLSMSLVLSIAAISGLVVAVGSVVRYRKSWHAYAVFGLAFTVPAFFFSAVHHGSFSRALATSLSLTTYLCIVGRYSRKAWIVRALVGVLSLCIHLQGAVLVAILALSEFLVVKPHSSRRRLFSFFAAGGFAAVLTLITLLGERFFKSHLEADITQGLFVIWRQQVISGFIPFIRYTRDNLLFGGGTLHAFAFIPLLFIGAIYLFFHRGIVARTITIFLLLMFCWVGCLLLLPDSPVLRLLALPFVSVVSRPYEGIAVILTFIASVGLVYLLAALPSRWKDALMIVVCAITIGIPAYKTQVKLIGLAKHFDTLDFATASRFHKLFTKTVGKDLVISTDYKFFSLADGKGVTSYLAYYDCPSPEIQTAECESRKAFADNIVKSVESGRLVGASASLIRNEIMENYPNIFVIIPTKEGISGPSIYRIDEVDREIVIQPEKI